MAPPNSKSSPLKSSPPMSPSKVMTAPKQRRADVVAGLTAAAVVLPKAMAYATVAGLPVAVGLYTAFVPWSSTGSSAPRGSSASARRRRWRS